MRAIDHRCGVDADCSLVGLKEDEYDALQRGIRGLDLALSTARPVCSGAPRAGRRLTVWRLPNEMTEVHAHQLITALSRASQLFCIASQAVGVVSCLQSGSHDALPDPYDATEALVRIRRLVDPGWDQLLGAHTAAVSVETGAVADRAREQSRIRPAELKLLRYLATNRHRFVPTSELQLAALGASGDGSAVRFHIKEIRRKLNARAIESRRGYGYRLVDDLT